MRPLHLHMKAFGPYAAVQEVDFRDLGEQTFFLIHGPTGAGKSSILDAICFALYGETSGEDRQGKQMRSDHADIKCLTEVRFTFALKGEVYHIHRIPEQQKPKKIGEGTTKQGHKATIWHLGAEGDDLDAMLKAPDSSGSVVASGAKKVSAAVHERIGFSVDQFRQVVVLPQGKFRRLLGGDAKTRQEILAVLFRTERYRQIEEALKEKHKELKGALEGVSRQRQGVLDRVEVDDEEALRALVNKAEEGLKALEAEVKDRRKEKDQAEAALQKGRQAQRLLDELQQATMELAALEAQKAEAEARRVELDAALRARNLRDLQGARDKRQEEAQKAADRAAGLQEQVAGARERKDGAEKLYDEQVALEPARSSAGREVERLEGLEKKVEVLEGLKNEASRAEARQEQAAKQVKEGDRKKQELAGLLERQSRQLQEARDGSARLAHLERLLQDADEALKLRKKLEEDRAEQELMRGEVKQAEQRLQKARKTKEAAKAALDELMVKWDGAHAARLAEQLKPGAPCPTCGSTEHPAPARCEDGAPDGEAVRRQRQAVEEADRRVEQARKACEELRIKREVHQTGQLQVVQSLGEDVDLSLAQLKARRDEAAARARAAGEAAKKVPRLEQAVGRSRTDLDAAEAALENAAQAAAEARSTRDKAQAQLELRQQEVPAELLEPGALAAATTAARKQRDGLAEALARATRELEEARVAYAGLKAEHKTALDVAEKADLEAARVRDEFLRRLADAEFADEETYTGALRGDAEVDALEQAARRYSEAYRSATDRRRRAEEAAAGLKPPPLTELEAAARTAAGKWEQVLEERADLAEKLKTRRALVAELESMAAQQSGLEKQFSVVGRLADVAKGSNPKRISFQRYVLTLFLDDVLKAATHRFRRMTRGRFELHRIKDGAQGRLAGLDLEVEDSHTGKNRPVSTLSGGEGFLASLSLALGLVDVVQRESGGIRLEAMFVDEGFGSLDSEALDQCLRVLRDLQSRGRLVGIISHVDELKNRGFVCLEVSPSLSGSEAKFTFP